MYSLSVIYSGTKTASTDVQWFVNISMYYDTIYIILYNAHAYTILLSDITSKLNFLE